MELNRIVITCAPRIVPFLKLEVESHGFEVQDTSSKKVEIEGTLNDAMYLNLHLRTANRILFHIDSFEASSPQQLYDHLITINWEEYIANDGYISINSFVKNDNIKDTRFANLRTKDAVVDRINEKTGSRPDAGPDYSKAVIFLHWVDEEASVYFDTSGETVSKHSYRKISYTAPMMESLAAATLIASEWDGNSTFVNPMCGSGTLAIEAAMLATNRAPGLLRDNFGFMHLKSFDRKAWDKIKEEATSKVKEELDFKIVATDIDPKAIKAARTNAQAANVDQFITFKTCPFEQTPLPAEPGAIFFNPEYGQRLGDESKLEPLYAAIGDYMKQYAKGYKGYIFTGNLDLAKRVGLKAKRKIEFYNGRIDCRLLSYELYAGSKKKS